MTSRVVPYHTPNVSVSTPSLRARLFIHQSSANSSDALMMS